MKPKNSILVVLAFAILFLGLWLFMREAGVYWLIWPAPTRRSAVELASQPGASEYVVPQAIAPPIAPPAPRSGVASETANSSSDLASADAQADLKTAFAKYASLLRAGDMVGFTQASTPPAYLANFDGMQAIQAAQASGSLQRPIWQKRLEGEAQDFDTLAGLTPTFNADGDEATYMITVHPDPIQGAGSNAPQPMVFVKIDGKWYIKPEKGN